MALNRPLPLFAHQHTVRLVVDEDMEIDALSSIRGVENTQPLVPTYKVISTKVVQQKCKSVRDNADWYYG